MRRAARPALASTALLSLALAGCAVPTASTDSPTPPIMQLFMTEQRPEDRLPPTAPGAIDLIPGTSRLLAEFGLHRFFVGLALGRPTTPFCIVVVDVYDRQVAERCGSDNFIGDYAPGVRFSFGSTAANIMEGAVATVGTSPHLLIEVKWLHLGPQRLIAAHFGAEQRDHDRLDIETPAGGSATSSRLVAEHDGRRYFVTAIQWPGIAFCLVELAIATRTDRVNCAGKNIVLRSTDGSEPTVHFSIDVFDDEPPAGWRQVTSHLRVREEARQG